MVSRVLSVMQPDWGYHPPPGQTGAPVVASGQSLLQPIVTTVPIQTVSVET